jgi:hypothetical protein
MSQSVRSFESRMSYLTTLTSLSVNWSGNGLLGRQRCGRCLKQAVKSSIIVRPRTFMVTSLQLVLSFRHGIKLCHTTYSAFCFVLPQLFPQVVPQIVRTISELALGEALAAAYHTAGYRQLYLETWNSEIGHKWKSGISKPVSVTLLIPTVTDWRITWKCFLSGSTYDIVLDRSEIWNELGQSSGLEHDLADRREWRPPNRLALISSWMCSTVRMRIFSDFADVAAVYRRGKPNGPWRILEPAN